MFENVLFLLWASPWVATLSFIRLQRFLYFCAEI